VLCIDELGYLPIDKFGADCLFQIISHRYARGATLISASRVYKQWANIFDKDAVLTSALLDRLLHHAEIVLIEGRSLAGVNYPDRPAKVIVANQELSLQGSGRDLRLPSAHTRNRVRAPHAPSQMHQQVQTGQIPAGSLRRPQPLLKTPRVRTNVGSFV